MRPLRPLRPMNPMNLLDSIINPQKAMLERKPDMELDVEMVPMKAMPIPFKILKKNHLLIAKKKKANKVRKRHSKKNRKKIARVKKKLLTQLLD